VTGWDEGTHYHGDGCQPPHPDPAGPRRAVVCGSVAHPELIARAVDAVRAAHEVDVIYPVADSSFTAEQHAAAWRDHIDRASEVVAVAKPDGTVGEATAAEVEYALQRGVPVRWHGPGQGNGTARRVHVRF
jgi:hypothetical protein